MLVFVFCVCVQYLLMGHYQGEVPGVLVPADYGEHMLRCRVLRQVSGGRGMCLPFKQHLQSQLLLGTSAITLLKSVLHQAMCEWFGAGHAFCLPQCVTCTHWCCRGLRLILYVAATVMIVDSDSLVVRYACMASASTIMWCQCALVLVTHLHFVVDVGSCCWDCRGVVFL